MEPLISVIVPVYNVEPYLRKCVDSILNQTYKNLEVILVDDGSPDGCPAICDEYATKDSRIKVIHKKNEGQAIARNIALNIASGDYVAFVDSDDWIDLYLYETVMRYAPFEAALFGCTYVSTQTGEWRIQSACAEPRMLCWVKDFDIVEEILRNSLYGYACNKVYKRDILNGLVYPDIRLREDLVFNMAVFGRTDQIQLINCEGYYYLQHENSTTRKIYSGLVPDIAAAAMQMTIIHPGLTEKENRVLSGSLIKQYLCDAMYQYIFMNQALNKVEAVKALRCIFANRSLAKMMYFSSRDGGLFMLMTICAKMQLPGVFYKIVKRKWHV